MATVTGKTSFKIDDLLNDILSKQLIGGTVNETGDLVLFQASGAATHAGNVKGQQGEKGDVGVEIVKHHENENIARPNAPVVHWIGTSRPLNAHDTDWWTRFNIP